MSRTRSLAVRVLPAVTVVWVLIELLSLRLGLLDRFFYDAVQADVQGIDYFSLPKAWLNLGAHRSAYDTFGPPSYGPHFTWYLSHPALALVLGWPLSHFAPDNAMSSYGAYTMLSLAMMAAAAWLLARQSTDPLHRRLIWLFVLGAFPTYWMLYVGNVQATLVLALAMVFAGMLRLVDQSPGGAAQDRLAGRMIFAGLLLSLLTKPAVLPMLPLLLLLRETRRPAALATAWYAGISVVCEVVPALNPEAIGLRRVFWLATHPAFVRDHMNIYTNGIALTADMKDNSIHWLNLVAQAQTRLNHIDVFSLPVFLDGLLGTHTPAWIYAVPTVAVFALSLAVARMRAPRQRLSAALLLLLAAALLFFVNYPTVWEYQYTAVLPVGAALLLLDERGLLGRPAALSARIMLALAACAFLPSLFFLLDSGPISAAKLTLIRLDRVVPATLLLLVLLALVGHRVLRGWSTVVNAKRANVVPDAVSGSARS